MLSSTLRGKALHENSYTSSHCSLEEMRNLDNGSLLRPRNLISSITLLFRVLPWVVVVVELESCITKYIAFLREKQELLTNKPTKTKEKKDPIQ